MQQLVIRHRINSIILLLHSRENLHRERFDSDASQRSVVYLHATTVGDIPSQTLGRRMSGKNSIKAALHDENQGTTVRTVNRSYSLNAPWKPKLVHYFFVCLK